MPKTNFTLFAVFCMAVLVLTGGSVDAEPSVNMPHALVIPVTETPDLLQKLPVLAPIETEAEVAEITEPAELIAESKTNPWQGYPNVCETFTAYQGKTKFNKKLRRQTNSVNYKRNRYDYPVSDQKRTKDLIRLVAREMGVTEPDFFVAMAAHESSFHPETIHILNEDLTANRKSWDRHSYSAAREAYLTEKLARTSTKTSAFWDLKSTLSSLKVYRDNPHWNTQVGYDLVIPGRQLSDGTTTKTQTVKAKKSVWSFGYGLYGHNAVLYTRSWSPSAPPWILCNHQGIIDMIVEVWVARSAARECAQLSSSDPSKYGREGGTYLGTLRRLGTGKCSDRPLKKKWQSILAEYGDGANPSARGGSVPWQQKATFGKEWPAATTSREEILAHMLKRAEEEGLLRPSPLERKEVTTTPLVVARK